MKKELCWFYFIYLFGIPGTYAQQSTLPVLVEHNGRHALLVDGKPFFMLGGQAHNSSGWPAMLPAVWSAAEVMHLNTLEVPLYWEQVEPEPGTFNFSVVDTLLRQARQHHIHLVLLWFGTWKNGSNHYLPDWMKRDAQQYPNLIGKTGQPVDSPSPHSAAMLERDIRAFQAVMHYLKGSDQAHTVLMVQVENEAGSWGSVRDYSPKAQPLFEAQVPSTLLNPAVLTALSAPVVSRGSWKEVFGERADEYFQAWSVATYIGQVAAAGKTAYSLPLYVNAALRDPLSNPSANSYESGGPTDNVIPIWKVAAPAIDILAPDIYLTGSERILKVIELYNRRDNPLFVPEAGFNPENVKYLYSVLAGGGLGYSPFGIDDNGNGASKAQLMERLEPFSREYALFGPMMSELARWGFEGKVQAVVEHEDQAPQTLDLGLWEAVITFGSGRGNALTPNKDPNGKMMIIKLEDNKFMIIGTACRVTFHPTGGNSVKAWQYLKVEEGRYEKGQFKLLRVLNGDETDWGGPSFGITPRVLRATLILR